MNIADLQRFEDWWILQECEAWDIDVRLEKVDYMVIYKPKWVLSHPNSVRDIQYPSVVWWVYHYLQQGTQWKTILPSTWSFVRAWLVHRLDKETDGLMIIAKTERWLSHFKDLFQRKSLLSSFSEKEMVPLKKYYLAEVHITSKWRDFLESISTSLPYIIDEDVIPKVPHAIIKRGITKITELTHDLQRWSIKVEILTGRTHQIRYHLSTYGLPIIWDYLYWLDDSPPMFLTAYRLDFLDCYWDNISLKLDLK